MISVILLVLTTLTYGQITDITIASGQPLAPTFDENIFQYTVDIPLNQDKVAFDFNNDNDRFWIQIFEDFCCDRSSFTSYFETPVYETSAEFDLEVGINRFFFAQENFQDIVYELIIDRTDNSVTTTETPTTTQTTTTVTTTPGPTETQVTTETPVVALPEQQPDVNACDSGFIDEVWVNLISQEGDATNECASLTVRSNSGENLPIEDTCPCFLAADKDYLYSLECRPNEATPYTFKDMAQWCNGEEQILEGPTDTVIVFNKTLEDFDISTWSGVDDQYVYPGQKLRQSFIGNDMDAETGDITNYMLVEFDTCLFGTWEAGDAITVEIGFTEVYRMEMPSGSYGTDCNQEDKHAAIIPLDPYFNTDESGDYHDFTLGFTSNLAGARDDEYFSVEPTRFELFSREDVSTYCLERYSYNASVNYPIFVQEDSGFIWNYAASPVESIRLHLEVLVPRQLFDFTIDFDNGKDSIAGYNEFRQFVSRVIDPTGETYWTSDLLTDETIIMSTQDNCGYETWIADIPWDDFNKNGAGGVQQFEEYSNGFTKDNATDWYLFGSTSRFTGYETIYTEEAGREWQTTRYSTWRVPFIVRFQRIVFVETDVSVILCPDDDNIRDPYCTITHVAAIVEQVQANTVYDLETRDYRADVNLKINTETFYPYMLVNGQAGDDPPGFWEDLNQTQYYPAPLTGQDGAQWFPPTIVYTAADYVDANTQVEASFEWLREEEEECTYLEVNNIEDNLGRICRQYWNMYIKPLNGACYIDGDYLVTWSARCFYEKPVCTFNTDDEGNAVNTVQATFTVHSTNMCPELVHEVDIFGEMCPTGRYDYALCAEAGSAEGVPPVYHNDEDVMTYFQDDTVHFFITTGSNDAKIIYTEILEIWVEQDFSDPEWPVDDSVTPVDQNYNGLVKLWDSSAADNSHSFTNSLTGLTETVPPVITETMTSNDFATYFPTVGHSAADTDYGVYAGYEVRVDSKIFPRTSDRWLDSTFRVKLLVWYEGWGDVKPDARRLLAEQEEVLGDYSYSGKQNMWVNQRIQIAREVPRIVPCFASQETQAWTLKMSLTPEQVEHMHGNFDHHMRHEMQGLFQSTEIEWVGFTQDQENENDYVAVFRAGSDKWDRLVEIFTKGDFKNGPMFFDLKVSDVYCMDAGEDVGLLALTECATGQPCVFLPDQVKLEDYYGQGQEPQLEILSDATESSALVLTTIFAFICALFF